MTESAEPTNRRRQWWILGGIAAGLVLAIAVILVIARPPDLATSTTPASDFDAVMGQPHITFQNTTESDFDRFAAVPLDSPGGTRVLGGRICDRSASNGVTTSCLSSKLGVATTYTATMYDSSFRDQASWSLPGTPSRTALSRDGALVATTVFVAGHSYMQAGFSTQTVIRAISGNSPDYGDLEKFSFTKDGKSYSARDINVWGITFAPDNRTFYASVSTADVVYLSKGDLDSRTLELMRPNVECPSLSPNSSTIAYKFGLGTIGQWRFHALTLETGEDRELGETRSVDDQVQWLDDTHIIYSVPRPDAAPATDVYSLPTDGQAPSLLIENASSPSVVRNPTEER